MLIGKGYIDIGLCVFCVYFEVIFLLNFIVICNIFEEYLLFIFNFILGNFFLVINLFVIFYGFIENCLF